MLMRLVGAATLVLAAMAAARAYRDDVAVRTARVQTWCRVLEELREGLASQGAPLSELLPPLLVQSGVLRGQEKTPASQRTLALLCERMADDLADNSPAADRLRALPCAFAKADHTQPLLGQLDEVIAAMRERKGELEEQREGKCRAVTALCICGALALVLTLW